MNDINADHLASNLEHYINDLLDGPLPRQYEQHRVRFENEAVARHIMTPLPGNAFLLTEFGAGCALGELAATVRTHVWYCMGVMPKVSRENMYTDVPNFDVLTIVRQGGDGPRHFIRGPPLNTTASRPFYSYIGVNVDDYTPIYDQPPSVLRESLLYLARSTAYKAQLKNHYSNILKMVGASRIHKKTGKDVTWREKYLQFRTLVMDGTARIDEAVWDEAADEYECGERSERCKEATRKFFKK